MFWVNGQPSQTVSLSDRSFQYGDGCFTTILSCHGKLQYWHWHVERMDACLLLLGIPSPDWSLVASWVEQVVLPADNAGVKIHVSRGEGGRGYSPTQNPDPKVTITVFDYPSHYIDWKDSGVELGLCRQRLGLNPLLAGHKHNNRLEQILLKAEMDAQGYVEGVALDILGHVIETTSANIFWATNDRLCTPNLDQAGVAGVARRRVLSIAQDLNLPISIDKFSLDDLLSADEVFITNSILGVAPVTKIAATTFSFGNHTRCFQECFTS
ncbi:aminodeoxychorismate lyase [Vibrio aestuarianus]|uniref:aminodeoxychorismate lyase n=1 Tax=Vibrio aestuarianus TaxID=28171 RepID=UPI00237C796B|nr:aminodeoxychorismate lyase [Vibrio aestuarianus]MDE1351132.1 aminodeoxychorismate lyase [Vibrio aestuarianus]